MARCLLAVVNVFVIAVSALVVSAQEAATSLQGRWVVTGAEHHGKAMTR